METPVLGWQFDPVLLGSLLTLAVSYALAVGPLRSKLAPGVPFPTRKTVIFGSALVLTYLTEGSPLHDLSERYLFSAHMVQHLLMMYFCAPLLIWGTPDWVLKPLLLNRFVYPVARVVTQPVFAGLTFALFLSLWHVPAVYDAGLRNSTVHHTQHVLFLIVAFVSWWPIMSPLKELPRLSYGAQILYLFVTSTVLQLPLFAIITFSDHAFYRTYELAPRILNLSATDDQALAGIIMKVLAMAIYSVPLVVIFFKWHNESQRSTRRTPPKPRPSKV